MEKRKRKGDSSSCLSGNVVIVLAVNIDADLVIFFVMALLLPQLW
jgi:hypothetical protein